MHRCGNDFSSTEAHQRLHDLATFLSFCHGHWVCTALTYGIDKEGLAVMEEWGTRKLSPWRRGTNWLDEHHGSCMVRLFPTFMHILSKTTEWKEAIEHAVYWYVRADTSLIGPDGACVLLQAALERLAWHVLVRDRHSLSEDGFARLSAGDQLRLLLASLSIPLEIPLEMFDLGNMAKEFSWNDGPQAFVGIRNRLVHPPKLGRRKESIPYLDAFLLGKWYTELAILSICGYDGEYANRSRKGRWRGAVEPVPWAC